jgi:type I restriction-modification system DNA methylase subunit
LEITDEALEDVLTLATYDFETDLNVNILGHIFEQSISDLEALRAEIRGEAIERGKSKRKQEGVFYTPEFITRFIVIRTVGGWLSERWQKLEQQHKSKKPGPMSKVDRSKLLHDYLERLANIKIVDPACGSGAFLVAVFDYLHAEYNRVNIAIADLTGQPDQMGLFDLDKQILNENLFGVDLNPESVEITKLSLWLKTARSDKQLNNLDGNIRCGNSLISPPSQDASNKAVEVFNSLPDSVRPFDWHEAFPEIFANGGFDVVLGNPPYVRQETISPIKPYLEQHYYSYNGVADLYVYFYEQGINLLNESGKLSYIVSNKWLRSGYGKSLRHFFTEQAEFEEIIDFGHAPIFEDADTFPCIIVAHRKSKSRKDATVHVCPVPRDRPTELSLEQYVEEHNYEVPWSRYGEDAWSLEPAEVETLIARLWDRGIPLNEFTGTRPLYGIKTGLNEAFLIDTSMRHRLISDDPYCASVIKPYLRGQDIKRWRPEWRDRWMITLKSSNNHNWPWSNSGENAEQVFSESYPSIFTHMKQHEDRLKARGGVGKHWWELFSCSYFDKFDSPKILYQEIQFHPSYAFASEAVIGNNKTFLIPSADLYLLAVLNSPLFWWHNWRYLPHMKDEALSPAGFLMGKLPIAEPGRYRTEIEEHTASTIDTTTKIHTQTSEFLGWLTHEYSIEKPGQKLESFWALSTKDFADEVKKRRPKGCPRLSPAEVTELQSTHNKYTQEALLLKIEILNRERRISELVNQAYGLSDEEIYLLWRTAPPRMPISPPNRPIRC